MRTYEMMTVFAPDIPDDQMPTALENVAGFVTTLGGEVTSLNTTTVNALTLGRRRLAYPIRKYRDGFYALYHITLDPSQIDELEREIRLNTQLLRHLITSYAPPKPRKPKKAKDGAIAVAEGESATEVTEVTAATAPVPAPAPAASAPAASATADSAKSSGAAVDDVAPLPVAPDGTEMDEPPTAETPETE